MVEPSCLGTLGPGAAEVHRRRLQLERPRGRREVLISLELEIPKGPASRRGLSSCAPDSGLQELAGRSNYLGRRQDIAITFCERGYQAVACLGSGTLA